MYWARWNQQHITPNEVICSWLNTSCFLLEIMSPLCITRFFSRKESLNLSLHIMLYMVVVSRRILNSFRRYQPLIRVKSCIANYKMIICLIYLIYEFALITKYLLLHPSDRQWEEKLLKKNMTPILSHLNSDIAERLDPLMKTKCRVL